MFYSIYKYWKTRLPRIKGWLFKLFFQNRQISIGKNFQCDTFPYLLLTQSGKLRIGDNVIFKRDVEIRSHQNASIEIGDNCKIDRGVRLLAANNATILLQEGVRIGLYSVMNGGDSISIGARTLVSGFVYLQTSMHRHKSGSTIQSQGYDHKAIVLQEDVWLGAHSVIMPGITIESGSIVGSNAVVTKNISKDNIVAGVPAEIIKARTS